jgi:glutamyl-tRNA synthetase
MNSFDSIGKAAAVFNPEKLLWLNSQYMMNTSPGMLVEMVMPFLIGEEIVSEGEQIDREWLARAIDTLKERSKTLVNLAKSLRYYISIDVEYDQKAKDKFLNEKTLPYLGDLRHRLDTLNEFSHPALEQLFRSVTETHGIKLGALAQPVRVAVTGGTESPGIFDVLEVLGKEKTLKKLDNAMRMIETSQGGTG